MGKLIPQLRFNDDKCREALDFYKQCFGDAEVTVMKIGDSPMAKEMPPESHAKIMHATFKSGDISFVASDMMMDKAVIGDNVTLMVEWEGEHQMRTSFDKISQGGQVFMPIDKMFWGALFGVVTDKYGIEWSFNYTLPK